MSNDQNEADFLAQELDGGAFGDQPPMVDQGEWPARTGLPTVQSGIGKETGKPWARIRLPFTITDEEQVAKMAPRKPTARYEDFLDVVEDASAPAGFRLATEADQEGANWKLKKLAKRLGIADGRITSLPELAERTAKVLVVHVPRRDDPEIKDPTVRRVSPVEVE